MLADPSGGGGGSFQLSKPHPVADPREIWRGEGLPPPHTLLNVSACSLPLSRHRIIVYIWMKGMLNSPLIDETTLIWLSQLHTVKASF